MQNVQVIAKTLAHGGEQLGHMVEVLGGVPHMLGGQVAVSRFIAFAAALGHAIRGGNARDPALHAHGFVTQLNMAGDFLQATVDVLARGMPIHHDPLAALATQQLVQRHVGGLGLDVPQRHVDGGNRGHGHRATAPVGPAIQVLPDVFDTLRIAADQGGQNVLFKVSHHGHFAAIQGGVADAIQAGVGDNFQGDQVAPRASDDHPRFNNFHTLKPQPQKTMRACSVSAWPRAGSAPRGVAPLARPADGPSAPPVRVRRLANGKQGTPR